MIDLAIRPFDEADAEDTARLFYASVHQGTRKFYSEEERQAWASQIPPTAAWRKRLLSQITYVATCNKTLAGFMTLAPDGYIDLAYVAPDYIGKGVGKRLYDVIEAKAIQTGATRLHTQASHLALHFFVRQGWAVIARQVVIRNNIPLTNLTMEKYLSVQNS